MRRFAALLAVVLLSSCGGPRDPIVTIEKAKNDRRQLDVSVLNVYDCLKVARPTESSHLIEVHVLDGPSDLIGKDITLPYDEWMVGAPPPKAGKRMTIAPADWVHKAPDSKGEPTGGWNRKSNIR